MPQILITKFAGMAPSISPKLLPEGFGTEVKNLDTRFGDFRPFYAAATVQSATAGATLYRFATNSSFITNTNDVDYARGPLASDTTERTYYTGDGAPKVTDITLAVRPLGVPKASLAPTITRVVVDELSTEEAETYYKQLGAKVLAYMNANRTLTYIGAARTAPWNGTIPTPSTSYEDQVRFTIPSSTVNGVKTPTKEIYKSLFGTGVEVDADNYAAILRARAPSYAFPNLKSILLTYTDAAGATLFTDAQAQKFVDFISDLVSVNNDYVKTRSAKLQSLADQFYAAASGGDGLNSAINAAWVNFYSQTAVTDAITKGKNTLAQNLLNMTNTLSSPTTYNYEA